MATDITDLFKGYERPSEFQPTVFYCQESDTLTFYFRDDPDYAKRLGKRVTLYLAVDSAEVVGCQIKGLRHILDTLPNHLEVTHGKLTLKMVFMVFMGNIDADDMPLYNEVLHNAEGRELELA